MAKIGKIIVVEQGDYVIQLGEDTYLDSIIPKSVDLLNHKQEIVGCDDCQVHYNNETVGDIKKGIFYGLYVNTPDSKNMNLDSYCVESIT